jgi:hypothetical protein
VRAQFTACSPLAACRAASSICSAVASSDVVRLAFTLAIEARSVPTHPCGD